MTILATAVEHEFDIEVGPSMNPIAQDILYELHGNCPIGKLECREHDDDPAFAHFRDEIGRVHGAYLYVQKRHGNWVLCHHPNNRDEFKLPAHEVPVGMSDQHKWQQDYWCRAADTAGYDADTEVPIDGTRLDVLMKGDVLVGTEVQHSGITARKAINRTKKANAAGITCLWSADHKNPPFAFRVPHIETNQLPDGNRPPGTWTVTTGPRRLIPKACTPANNFSRCPMTRRSVHCGKYHPTFAPMPQVVVDYLAERLPAGDIVPVNTNTKQGTVLLTKDHRELWMHEFAHQYPPPKQRQYCVNPCGYDPSQQIADAHPLTCRRCNQQLLLHRPGREVCARCCGVDTYERLLRGGTTEGGAKD